ncbi:hypothetical protein G7Y89_g7312 [Cudoniella acicularis]|uniref:Uncharacterized protein n=1 Tax=Cudoniella acicularis TaxID=354080 RepID=A0A8H4W272_9HELO|nr:hypothetical protein G7Y89_g7312 [Cudoniella acicularis]
MAQNSQQIKSDSSSQKASSLARQSKLTTHLDSPNIVDKVALLTIPNKINSLYVRIQRDSLTSGKKSQPLVASTTQLLLHRLNNLCPGTSALPPIPHEFDQCPAKGIDTPYKRPTLAHLWYTRSFDLVFEIPSKLPPQLCKDEHHKPEYNTDNGANMRVLPKLLNFDLRFLQGRSTLQRRKGQEHEVLRR